MTKGNRFPVGLFFIIFSLLTLLLAAEFFVEWSTATYPVGHPLAGQPVQWSDIQLNAAMVRAITSPFARAYNNILALLLTFIAIAIPITANMYTPKLINIFLRDKVNLFVLGAGGVLAAHSVFAAALSFDLLYSRYAVWLSCVGAIVGWAALIPYYYYVLQFLNPETIIERVKASIAQQIRVLPSMRGRSREAQVALNQRISHLGSVLLQSVGRTDRDVTIESVRAFSDVLLSYADQKKRLPDDFFGVDQFLFTGMSHAAIEIMNRDRVWVEQRCLQQLALAYAAALSKMPDAVSTITDVVKYLAYRVSQNGDAPLLDLHIRFMNTFLREAINRKDIHAIYDVFYQYKSLLRRLMASHSEKFREMLGHLYYYSEMARNLGLSFIRELASYEFGELCEAAFATGKRELARDVLHLQLRLAGVEKSVRLVKSRIILASFFLNGDVLVNKAGEHDANTPFVEAIARSLEQVPSAVLQQAQQEILSLKNPVFWEVTDRQINIDFIDDVRKERLEGFFQRFLTTTVAG